MAYEIAFCDDDASAAALFLPKIKAVFRNYAGSVSITAFQDPHRLLNYLLSGNACDILFVDIDMPKVSGISLCRQLQAHNYRIPVVFLSNMEDRVYETFEFTTVYFLRKRCFDADIEKVAKRAFRDALFQAEAVLFSNKTQSYRIAVSTIKYIEIMNQTLSVYTTGSTVSLHYKMEKAEDMLLPYGFLRVHKGFLVNYRYIDRVQRQTLRLTDGTVIPVSRRRYKSIQEALLRLVTNEIRDGDGI